MGSAAVTPGCSCGLRRGCSADGDRRFAADVGAAALAFTGAPPDLVRAAARVLQMARRGSASAGAKILNKTNHHADWAGYSPNLFGVVKSISLTTGS
jgi:hypothetical protein